MYVDIRLNFEHDKYEYPDISSVEFVGSDLSEEERRGFTEMLFQSDFGQIEFPNAIFEAIEGKDTKFND